MVNLQMLNEEIKKSGLKLGKIAENMGITRQSLYNKLKGIYPFSNSDAVSLIKILNLSKKQSFEIFFDNKKD